MANDYALGLVDDSVSAASAANTGLSDLWENQQISPTDFRDVMRQQLKEEGIRQYTMGRGGVAQMTPEDWGSVGGSLADQYRYLDGMVDEMEAGNVSAGQVRRRVDMYFNSTREMYYRGLSRAKGMGFGELPAYPGDGSTVCLTSCKCSWDIQEILDDNGAVIAWEAYWRLGVADHCDDCTARASMWNPLTIEARTLYFQIEKTPFALDNQCWRCRRQIREPGFLFDAKVGGVEGRYFMCQSCEETVKQFGRLEKV